MKLRQTVSEENVKIKCFNEHKNDYVDARCSGVDRNETLKKYFHEEAKRRNNGGTSRFSMITETGRDTQFKSTLSSRSSSTLTRYGEVSKCTLLGDPLSKGKNDNFIIGNCGGEDPRTSRHKLFHSDDQNTRFLEDWSISDEEVDVDQYPALISATADCKAILNDSCSEFKGFVIGSGKATVSANSASSALTLATIEAATKVADIVNFGEISLSYISLIISSVIALNGNKIEFTRLSRVSTRLMNNSTRITKKKTNSNKPKEKIVLPIGTDVISSTNVNEIGNNIIRDHSLNSLSDSDLSRYTFGKMSDVLLPINTYEQIVNDMLRKKNNKLYKKRNGYKNGFSYGSERVDTISLNQLLSDEYWTKFQKLRTETKNNYVTISSLSEEFHNRMNKARKDFFLSLSHPAELQLLSDDKNNKLFDDKITNATLSSSILLNNNSGQWTYWKDFLSKTKTVDLTTLSKAIDDVKPFYVHLPSKHDNEYETVVERAKHSWAQYRKRESLLRTNLYAKTRSNGYLETNFDEKHYKTTLVDSYVVETNLDDIARLIQEEFHFNQKIKETNNKSTMSDVKRKIRALDKSASVDREVRKNRAKSVDYLVDKNARDEIEPPENQLQKILGDKDETQLSVHELRFRKSFEKLQIPEWYLNSEYCSAKPTDSDRPRFSSVSDNKYSTPTFSLPTSPEPVSAGDRPKTVQSQFHYLKRGSSPKAQTPILVAKFSEAPTLKHVSPPTGGKIVLASGYEKPKTVELVSKSFYSPTLIDNENSVNIYSTPETLKKPPVTNIIVSVDKKVSSKGTNENGPGEPIPSSRVKNDQFYIPRQFFEKYKDEIEEARQNRINLREHSAPKSAVEKIAATSDEVQMPLSKVMTTTVVSPAGEVPSLQPTEPNKIINLQLQIDSNETDDNVKKPISKVTTFNSPANDFRELQPSEPVLVNGLKVQKPAPSETVENKQTVSSKLTTVASPPKQPSKEVEIKRLQLHSDNITDTNYKTEKSPFKSTAFTSPAKEFCELQPSEQILVNGLKVQKTAPSETVETKQTVSSKLLTVVSPPEQPSNEVKIKWLQMHSDNISETNYKTEPAKSTTFTRPAKEFQELQERSDPSLRDNVKEATNKVQNIVSKTSVLANPASKEYHHVQQIEPLTKKFQVPNETTQKSSKDTNLETRHRNAKVSFLYKTPDGLTTVQSDWMPSSVNQRNVIVEESDIMSSDPSQDPSPVTSYTDLKPLKEVLDNLFELSKITPQVVYLQNKNEESIDESHRVITNADWYPDYGVFSMNKITMDTCEKIPEVSGNLLKKEVLWVRCHRCKQSRPIRGGGSSFVSCHHCYTYYCSRECRKKDWTVHMSKCNYAKISLTCKKVLNHVRMESALRELISDFAKMGYTNRGRGCVNFVFRDYNSAKRFVEEGWRKSATPVIDHLYYQTLTELEKANNVLLKPCSVYNPDDQMLLNTCVVIDGANIAETPEIHRKAVPDGNNIYTTVHKENRDIPPINETKPLERAKSLPYRKKSKQAVDAKEVLKSVLKSLENIVPGPVPLPERRRERKSSTPVTPPPFDRKSIYRHTVGISGRKYFSSDGTISPVTWSVPQTPTPIQKTFKFPITETDL